MLLFYPCHNIVTYSVAVELVKKKAESLPNKTSEDEVPSLLELYLTSPNLDYKDVVGMAVDLLLAGIDTVCDSLTVTITAQNFAKLFSVTIYKHCFPDRLHCIFRILSPR